MHHWTARVLLAAGILSLAAPAAADGLTKCRMTYDLSGWAVIYKTSKGTGRITCDNGQAANVRISTHGGGATVGTSTVVGGRGVFSGAGDIEELYGTYVEATAHAGAGASSDARAMTKGNVSLSLAGTGQGFNVGVAFGGFTIEPR